MLSHIKKYIPKSLFRALQPAYHLLLATIGMIIYRYPSRNIKIVGITGTKGKTSTAEIVNAILEAAGYKTALAGTLRFKIGENSKPNLYKMTMPGRLFVQSFLRQAVDEKCDWVVLEMTSEGAKQWRHKWVDLDALIFTNLAPEHIESHGSFEKYLHAKLSIAKNLENKHKETYIIANADDEHSKDFLSVKATHALGFSLKDAKPYQTHDHGISLSFQGALYTSQLRGEFNVLNILGALTFAKAYGISPKAIQKGLNAVSEIRGRVESVRLPSDDPDHMRQNFEVIVDYAHTPDSLTALYKAFEDKKKICVLGNTGGGRDTWKRKVMGSIANDHCSEIILTDEDPYDEDPRAIINEMVEGIQGTPYKIIMDRREAIYTAISHARSGDVVLITGKGTDPYIMGPSGSKTPWSDSDIAREELKKVFSKSKTRA